MTCKRKVQMKPDSIHPDLERACEELKKRLATCVLCKGDVLEVSMQHGIRPLLDLILSGADYTGFFAADQIVGKAAALLYAKMGIAQVYAEVLSEKALPVFAAFGIRCTAERTVPYIINRSGDGMCPMEQTVLSLDDPDEAYAALLEKERQLSRKTGTDNHS